MCTAWEIEKRKCHSFHIHYGKYSVPHTLYNIYLRIVLLITRLGATLVV